MTIPSTTSTTLSDVDRLLTKLVMSDAGLEPGRWAVRVESADIPEVGEVAFRAVASIRVHATVDAGERDADPTSGMQSLAHKLGRELRRALDVRETKTADELEQMRRLHEEATTRAAAAREALKALVERAEAFPVIQADPDIITLINAAREVLAS